MADGRNIRHIVRPMSTTLWARNNRENIYRYLFVEENGVRATRPACRSVGSDLDQDVGDLSALRNEELMRSLCRNSNDIADTNFSCDAALDRLALRLAGSRSDGLDRFAAHHKRCLTGLNDHDVH